MFKFAAFLVIKTKLLSVNFILEQRGSVFLPVIMDSSTIAAISQEAFPSSREFIDVEIPTSADQNLLFEVTAIIKPVKTDFSEHCAVE